jgi:S-adenosyl-L-methionine hydrolase (adenosine-forming)
MKRPVITLLTDFGAGDHYVAAMKGVLLGICPGAKLVDISHEIAPFAIAEAAFTLEQTWRYFPRGTVHLIVVDPGVGSERRPILVDAGGHRFVAPDNGVLTMLFASTPLHKVRAITASRYFREPVSKTFHGRDIFAPAAARLACGLSSARLGPRIDNYLQLDFAEPVRQGRRWTGSILKIDRFGNLITNFDSATLEQIAGQRFRIKVGTRNITKLATHYSEVPEGELFAIAGSAGFLEISMNLGSAAQTAAARPGGNVEIQLLDGTPK